MYTESILIYFLWLNDIKDSYFAPILNYNTNNCNTYQKCPWLHNILDVQDE